MIYFLLFVYLFYLVVKYDILDRKRNKRIHFYVIIILLILISGFRYRLGTDTYSYINEFERYPDLFHLTIEDFSNFRYQPFWILLNSIGKTLGSFIFVQFVVSLIHIGLLGKFLRQICPSLIFSSLFLYYLFDYMVFNMEVMRESVSISFFLMALLALNRGEKKRTYIYVGLAFMFHAYSLVVFILFELFRRVFPRNKVLSCLLVCGISVICIIDKNFIINLIMNHLSGTNTLYTESAIIYATSKWFGETDMSWKGILVTFTLPAIYIYLLFYTKSFYLNYVRLNRSLFEAAIFMAVSYILLRYSLGIIDRMYNYFHVFTFLLIALYVKQKSMGTKNYARRIPVCMLLMLIPILCACRMYTREDSLVEGLRFYSRYYPYSSIFDRTKDAKRELIFVYKDHMAFD